MPTSLTIEVPESLAARLQPHQARLAEILERGLRDVLAEQVAGDHDAAAIIAILASQPSPDEVLAIQPQPQLAARAGELLARSKQMELSAAEQGELERYLLLEHLVRLAKTHAYHQLQQSA